MRSSFSTYIEGHALVLQVALLAGQALDHDVSTEAAQGEVHGTALTQRVEHRVRRLQQTQHTR